MDESHETELGDRVAMATFLFRHDSNDGVIQSMPFNQCIKNHHTRVINAYMEQQQIRHHDPTIFLEGIKRPPYDGFRDPR